MPELPEVETTRRGIEPHIIGRRVNGATIRQPQLRWPVPPLDELLPGQRVNAVTRRAKYILITFQKGTLIIHLGMSGSLRIVSKTTAPRPHDRVELCFGKQCLRLHDPRRFGAMLWTEDNPLKHPRICDLGPEPLSEAFNGDYLYHIARTRRAPIKNLIMDGKTVVGVGNIYATEALFAAGIHPQRASNRVSRVRLESLVDEIKKVLAYAIERGGTTLRDFVNETGNPGYFAQELMVYGRAGKACKQCGNTLKTRQIGQRASAYCAVCQR